MLEYGNYIVLEDEKDYGDYTVLWEDDESVRLQNLGRIEKVAFYPQCYRYEEPWDNHFCGTYKPCDIDELIGLIEESKNFLNDMLEKIENII